MTFSKILRTHLQENASNGISAPPNFETFWWSIPPDLPRGLSFCHLNWCLHLLHETSPSLPKLMRTLYTFQKSTESLSWSFSCFCHQIYAQQSIDIERRINVGCSREIFSKEVRFCSFFGYKYRRALKSNIYIYLCRNFSNKLWFS